MTSEKRITLQIVGTGADEHVGFGEFIRQLEEFKKALTETDRIVTGAKTVGYRVVDLSHKSPASVVLEAVSLRKGQSDAPARVIAKVFSSIQDIGQGTVPEGFDYEAMQAFRSLVTGKKGAERSSNLAISRDGDALLNLEALGANIDKILGPAEREYGSWTGNLESINIHAGQNVFVLYPTINMPKLRCVFPVALRPQAISAVGRYVTVFGQKHFIRWRGRTYPTEMRVRNLEIHPRDEDLPKLSEMRGLMRGASDLESEEMVRRLRDEWN